MFAQACLQVDSKTQGETGKLCYDRKQGKHPPPLGAMPTDWVEQIPTGQLWDILKIWTSQSNYNLLCNIK